MLPAVLVGSLAAVALPGAVPAPRSPRSGSGDVVAAAVQTTLLPEGRTTTSADTEDVDVLAFVDEDDPAPKRTTMGVETGAALTVGEQPAPPPAPPAVDGTPADTAPVDQAAVAAQATQALSGTGGVRDGATGIPATVLAAYHKAEANLAAAKPSCHLPWWVLAGIGKVESDHAEGGRVDANGTTRGRIVGIALDGSVPGTAVITDSDGGKWDGDSAYDRAVGPMQFLPGSWRYWGKDGNGDGVADPNNVFDAATGAGYLLCSAGDLSSPDALSRAVLMYNHSASYVATVLTWGAAYRDGATPSPDALGAVAAAPAKPVVTPPPPAAPSPSPTSAAKPSTSSGSPSSLSSSSSRSTTSSPTTPPSSSTPGTSTTSSTTSTTTSPRTSTTTDDPATAATTGPGSGATGG